MENFIFMQLKFFKLFHTNVLFLQHKKTHLKNSSATADELFERVWPFCGVGALKVKYLQKYMI